jgi:hypothetical protein
MYFNPALTGVNGDRKISAVFRNQWPSSTGSIRSTFVSYQDGTNNFGNFGAYYMNGNYSNGTFNSNRIGLNYAKPINVTENLTITPGISGTLIYDRIDFSKITFGYIANPRTGEMYDPLELKENNFSGNFGGGVIADVEKCICRSWLKPIWKYRSKFYLQYIFKHRNLFKQ